MANANAKFERKFLSVKEAEEITGRSKWGWRRDAYIGLVASVKIGQRLMIPISEIERRIAEGTRPRVVA